MNPLPLLNRPRKVALLFAVLLVLVAAVLSLLGMRSDVAALSGWSPSGDPAAPRGVAYVAAWLGAIVVAPPLVLFVLFDLVAERLPSIFRWIGSSRR